MLIDVFAGPECNSATPRGSLHFARAPEPGEQVEIEGVVLIVTRAWHRPDIYYPGAKFSSVIQPIMSNPRFRSTTERSPYSTTPQGWRDGVVKWMWQVDRQAFKNRRSAALAEWQNLAS